MKNIKIFTQEIFIRNLKTKFLKKAKTLIAQLTLVKVFNKTRKRKEKNRQSYSKTAEMNGPKKVLFWL